MTTRGMTTSGPAPVDPCARAREYDLHPGYRQFDPDEAFPEEGVELVPAEAPCAGERLRLCDGRIFVVVSCEGGIAGDARWEVHCGLSVDAPDIAIVWCVRAPADDRPHHWQEILGAPSYYPPTLAGREAGNRTARAAA